MKKTFLKIFGILFGLSLMLPLSSVLAAVNPADKDISFDTGVPPGFNTSTTSSVVQADGKVVVAGYFTTFQGLSAKYIIRLNTDGSRDDSFNVSTGFNDVVRGIAIQPDGKIIAVGQFTQYQGVSAPYIIRLNTDGSRDSSFNVGNGFNQFAINTYVQADGKIIVVGAFYTYQGATANYIIRLNSDGSKDTSFATNGMDQYFYGETIVVQNDGKVLVGGQGTKGIVRLNSDGSRDSSFNIGNGFNNTVRRIELQADGKILVGGNFTNYAGSNYSGSTNYIIRLNSDGTKDTSFDIGNGFNSSTYGIIPQNDGKIIIGGDFTTYKGTTANRIIRLNSDGSKDTSFDTIIGTGPNYLITNMIKQNNGQMIVVGQFTTYQGSAVNRILKLNADGSRDTSFNVGAGFNNYILRVFIQSDGKILVGGPFNDYKGASANGIVRLNTDATKDTTFDMGVGLNPGYDVRSIAQQADGKILVGGNFYSYQGVSSSKIVRINTNGSRDSTFNIGAGFNSDSNYRVESMVVQPDGKILVGGYFTTYKGVSQNMLIRLNSDGSKDTSFDVGAGFNSTVYSMILQPDGKILVGGYFSTYKGVSQNMLIRLNSDGSKDTSFDVGAGFNGYVYSMALQPDGKIVAVGGFTSYQGVNTKMIIRLNSNGSRDTSFDPGSGLAPGYVYSVILEPDGKILVGGNITTYQGISAPYIIRLNSDGTKDTTFDPGVGFNSIIYSMALQTDGKIIAAGYFSTYKGSTAGYLIRINGGEQEGLLPVFLSDTQIITYLLKTKKTVDPKWLFMGTIPLYF